MSEVFPSKTEAPQIYPLSYLPLFIRHPHNVLRPTKKVNKYSYLLI